MTGVIKTRYNLLIGTNLRPLSPNQSSRLTSGPLRAGPDLALGTGREIGLTKGKSLREHGLPGLKTGTNLVRRERGGAGGKRAASFGEGSRGRGRGNGGL